MLEVLQFIFSSFWVWAGTLLLVCAFGDGIGRVLAAIRAKE